MQTPFVLRNRIGHDWRGIGGDRRRIRMCRQGSARWRVSILKIGWLILADFRTGQPSVGRDQRDQPADPEDPLRLIPADSRLIPADPL